MPLRKALPQWFQASKAHMNRRVRSALPGYGAGSSQHLDAPGLRTAAVVSPFCQRQKKVSAGLIVFSNPFDQGQELLNQRQGEAVGLQAWLLQRGEDTGRNFDAVGMSAFSQSSFKRGRRSGCWIGWQKHQRPALLPLAEELQRDRVGCFQASGELVPQVGLPLNQRILTARHGFAFGALRAIRLPPTQVGKLRAAIHGPKIGIYQIRPGSRSCPLVINGFGIDRIKHCPRFQQRGDEQALSRYAPHAVGPHCERHHR